MSNSKIVVDGRVTAIRRIADIRRVRVWVEFCLAGMDSRTIYPRTTHPIAIPSGEGVRRNDRLAQGTGHHLHRYSHGRAPQRAVVWAGHRRRKGEALG
jgi:hypothetical protein